MQQQSKTAEHPYLQKIRARLRGFFDFEPVPDPLAGVVQSWAHFVQTDEKYFLSRKMNLYTVNAHRFVGVGLYRAVTPETVERAFADLKNWARRQGPAEQTMSIEYTAALVSEEPVAPEAVELLTRMKSQIGFALGLKGWADIAIIVVDLANERVWANPYGRAQLQTVLWSFDDKPVVPAKKSWISKIPVFRCSCTG